MRGVEAQLLQVGKKTLTKAELKTARLRIKKADWFRGYALDLMVGVLFPSVLGACMAAIAVGILKNVDGSESWVLENIYSEQVLSSLGTMVVFLVTLRLGANLSRNGVIIGHFGSLCGACVNLAMTSRSLIRSGQLTKIKMQSDGDQGHHTVEIGLLLSSIPYTARTRTFRTCTCHPLPRERH